MRPKKPDPPKVSDLIYPGGNVVLMNGDMLPIKGGYPEDVEPELYTTGSTKNTIPRSLVYGECGTGLSELFYPDAHDWEQEKPEPELPDVVCAHCVVINPFLEEVDDLMVRRGRCVACGSPLPEMDQDQEQVKGSPGITLDALSKQFHQLADNANLLKEQKDRSWWERMPWKGKGSLVDLSLYFMIMGFVAMGLLMILFRSW